MSSNLEDKMSQSSRIPRPSGLPIRTPQISIMSPKSKMKAQTCTNQNKQQQQRQTEQFQENIIQQSNMLGKQNQLKTSNSIPNLNERIGLIKSNSNYQLSVKISPIPKDNSVTNDTNISVNDLLTKNLTIDEKQVGGKDLLTDCQKIVKILRNSECKRNSGEFDSKRDSAEFDESFSSCFSVNSTLNVTKNSHLYFSTDNIDFSDDIEILTPGLVDLSDPVDRTPSVENLPMECDSLPTPGAELQNESRTQTVSIVTSITSVLSLDTGYQGDGEFSRPESRNAEEKVNIKFEDKTMTDSDFYTESEADVENSDIGKGNRKAQIIDGTLYQKKDTILVEDMESSGIYSDFEKKSDDIIPDKTESEPIVYLGIIMEKIKNMNEKQEVTEGNMITSSSGESSATIQENTVKEDVKDKKEEQKKPKMPNRNVSSRVKAMIVTNKTADDVKPKVVKKGKWDDVMDKIQQRKDEVKYTPAKFKEVKSKVFQHVTTTIVRNNKPPDLQLSRSSSTSSKIRSRRSTRVRRSESSLVSPISKQSRRSVSPNSSQRSSLSDISASSATNLKTNNRGSKKRDSINRIAPTVNTTVKNEQSANNKRQTDIQNGNVLVRNHLSTNMKTPNVKKTPTTPRRADGLINKSLKDSNQNVTVQKTAPRINQNNIINNNNNNNRKIKQTQQQTQSTINKQTKNKQIVDNNVEYKKFTKDEYDNLLQQLTYNCRGFQSVAVLLNYCRLQLDKEKSNTIESRLNLEELKATNRRLQEEHEQQNDKINEIKEECYRSQEEGERWKKLVESLKEENNKIQTDYDKIKNDLDIRIVGETELCEQIKRIKDAKVKIGKHLDQVNIECNCLKERLCCLDIENEKLKSENVSLVEKINQRSKCCDGETQTDTQEPVQVVDSTIDDKVEVEEHRVGRSPKRHTCDKPSWLDDVDDDDEDKTPLQRRLESDVESFMQALDLKTNEVKELRCQMLKLKHDGDRVPNLLSTITSLQANREVLQQQLSSQVDTVRSLMEQRVVLEEELAMRKKQDSKQAQHIEELKYKLRMYAEAMEKMASDNFKATSSYYHSLRKDSPNTSQMKGVVEKSDSVSYVLEMPEDSSEVVSNIVRRSQSMRSANKCQTLPKKRCKTLSSSCYSTPKHHRTRSLSVEDEDDEDSDKSKHVKLEQSDFTTDSIELSSNGDNCEIIEITQNFDKDESKVTSSVMTSSTSSSSSTTSSSTSSNYDIESDLFINEDIKEEVVEVNDTFQPVVLPTYKDIEPVDTTVVIASGGEGMISEFEDDDKN